jgi:lipopolysaccharide export system permease protein
MEGHHRIAMPFLPLSFTLVGLAFLLGGDFNRRGQLFRILGAVATVLLIEIAQLGAKNLGEKVQGIYVFMYLAPLIPALVAGWLLSARGEVPASTLPEPRLT